MFHEDSNEGLHTDNDGMQYNNPTIIFTNSKSFYLGIPPRSRFIVKVFLTNVLQIYLSMLMTALVFVKSKFIIALDKHSWVGFILSLISIGATIAIFIIQRFPHLKFLTDLFYTLFTFSFAGVVTFLSINVEEIFIFISWMMAIILSVILFLVGIKIKHSLVTYLNSFLIYAACVMLIIFGLALASSFKVHGVEWAIGPLVLAIVIPASLIEAQLLCGGREIYYRFEDYILASMVHLFLITLSFGGFIYLFINVKL
ncbi:unnamed protein product [Schistosoma turkestanicum]|nr:unnamed protein product [Schistosoma turkestanicum]